VGIFGQFRRAYVADWANSRAGERVFRPDPDVRYVVVALGVQIINVRTREAFSLSFPQSAVWDMASRGYSLDLIAEKLAAASHWTLKHSAGLAAETLGALEAKGFLSSEIVNDVTR
jgi:hypothetical protein